jgi:hypothetical protein
MYGCEALYITFKEQKLRLSANKELRIFKPKKLTVVNDVGNKFILCCLHLVLLLSKSRGIRGGELVHKREITNTYMKNMVFRVVM